MQQKIRCKKIYFNLFWPRKIMDFIIVTKPAEKYGRLFLIILRLVFDSTEVAKVQHIP